MISTMRLTAITNLMNMMMKKTQLKLLKAKTIKTVKVKNQTKKMTVTATVKRPIKNRIINLTITKAKNLVKMIQVKKLTAMKMAIHTIVGKNHNLHGKTSFLHHALRMNLSVIMKLCYWMKSVKSFAM